MPVLNFFLLVMFLQDYHLAAKRAFDLPGRPASSAPNTGIPRPPRCVRVNFFAAVLMPPERKVNCKSVPKFKGSLHPIFSVTDNVDVK